MSAHDNPAASLDAGRYEILEALAVGRMAIIYRARDLALGRVVAVKVLRGECQAGSTAAQRFAEEAQITAQLEHPGIPPVYEIGTLPDGRPYFAMKLIKGRSMQDLLNERPDPVADRRYLAVFSAACQVMAYAHCRGVIHRDLKPSNIMVGAFGEVLVMDWGLAKVLDVSDGDGVDCRSDVFALGGILFSLLTGSPFGGTNVNETGRAERLAGCGADAELVALVKRCLSPRPEDRPADAGEVAELVASHRAASEERMRDAWAAEGQKLRRVVLALVAAVVLLAATCIALALR